MTPKQSTFKTITIRWERGSKMPTMRGKWKRLSDGRILAMYTRAELAQCLEVCEAISNADSSESDIPELSVVKNQV